MFLESTLAQRPAPGRIISLVPSQTELLFSLGLSEEVTGITKFCVHPPQWHSSKTTIGGTKNLHIDQIIALQPNLIIANKEENIKEQVEQLASHFPVWVTDVNTVDDALQMITDIGNLTFRQRQANEIKEKISGKFQNIEFLQNQPVKAAYLIWNEPLMVAANGTFIHDMLIKAGIDNVFGKLDRYPEIATEDIMHSEAEIIFLSSEPYPFGEKHLEEFWKRFPGKKILLVDGEIFSWYGSRMLLAPDYFEKLHQKINHLNF